jgi:hypothetical protein
MEPAVRRPDDKQLLALVEDHLQAALGLTDGQPKTSGWPIASMGPPLLQWSRPIDGRMTGHQRNSPPSGRMLQWSRPVVGRMTHRADRSRLVLPGAAMELARGRPDDAYGYPFPARDLRAAMEPADEQPDDDQQSQARGPLGYAVAMEPTNLRAG